VVLCDDLSFEDGAAEAKALKSALEGGVAGPPANVMLVATSNRRHLMPRDHDEDQGAIAAKEDAEEEVSVSDRFGLWIGFPPMDQNTYLAAVRGYAQPASAWTCGPGASRPAVVAAARRALGPGGLAVRARTGGRAGREAAG
jgi:predicted AAA+ superfamily ATPase